MGKTLSESEALDRYNAANAVFDRGQFKPILESLAFMQEQNKAIIALLQDIHGSVNELIPFPAD